MRRVGLFVLACCVGASATNYYVSSSGGNDSNSGTSAATAWKTFSGAGTHINAGSFSAGDVIFLKRGDVWNEQLIPPSSGTSGSPIQFDAYGTGAAPVITAAAAIPFVSGSWTYISGNVWRTSASLVTGMGAATTVDMAQFGALYGRHQPFGSGCTGSIVSKYDWCVVWPNLYVYSGNGSTPPTTTYLADGAITAYVDSVAGLPLISVVNKSWLTFQHIKVQGFSYIGVSVTGTSDNIVFANMESDGMVPYGTTPHGFYVSASAGHGANIQFLNDDANLNYDGFRVDAATAVTVKNCRGYANRDAGLRDNTPSGTVVGYSNSHFYGNNVAQFPATDVVGGIAGSGNVALVCGAAAGLPATMCSSTAAPAVTNFATYPARFSFTVDDVGSASGTEAYINSFLGTSGTFSSRGLKFNAAVVPSYSVDWASVNNWYASGDEIDSHSWSHQYYTTTATPSGTCTVSSCPNAPALKIQYTGSGTAATMTVSGTTLSTNVTGAPADNIVGINLANPPYNQMGKTGTGGWGLANYLNTLPYYSVVLDTDAGVPLVRPNTYTVNLAGTTGSAITISGQDIKSAPFVWAYDQTLLLPDEMKKAKSAIESNVAGLNVGVYVYPDGIEDFSSEVDAVAAGYTAARGSLAMKGQDNSTGSANSLYANGVNVQNITSLAAIQIHGMTQVQINQIAASLVFRAAAWGAPYGLFTHFNTRGDGAADISNSELGWLLDAITAKGGLWLTNTGLANAITAGTGISGTTRYVQNPSGGAVNLAVALAHSPTVGRGAATAYPVDLDGVDRSKLGAWDIGARAYLAQRYGAAGAAGSTRIGGWPTGLSVSLPQVWVNSNEWMGTTTNAISYPTTSTGGSWTCGATNYGPYTAGSQASLNQAIADAEACRTANGSGATITIPAGAVFSGTFGLTLPQTVGDTSTNFIVLQSSTPLPTGHTVCSHGIQDNLAASTQPGIRNLGCDGSSMSYQLGTTVTPVSGAFTLANGTATNTSAYNDKASMYTIEVTGAYNAFQTAAADANGVGPHHFAILNAELRPDAGNPSTLSPVVIGTGSETATGQIPTHIHLAYDYIHGDIIDAPVSGGVATGSPNGVNSLPNDISLFGCINCSVSYSYVDKSLRPGSEGHAWAVKLGQTLKFVHNWFEGQSIGSMTGGAAGSISIPNFIEGQDIEDRGNRYTYPYSWLLAADAGFLPNTLMSTTGTGTCSGVTLKLTGGAGGAINTVSIVGAGSACAVNDVLTITQPNGGNNGMAVVTGATGGAVTSVAVASGTGYSVANGLALSGGHGTGATVNITSVDPAGHITGMVIASGGTNYSAGDNSLSVVQGANSSGKAGVGVVTGGVIQDVTGATGSSYYPRNSYVRKNGHETKTANRYLFDGNIVENVDNSGAQGGQSMEWRSSNTSSGLGDNYWVVSNHTTITNNVLRNDCVGPIMGQRSIILASGGGGVTAGSQFYNYSNNLLYNTTITNPGCAGQTVNYGFRLAGGSTGSSWTTSSAVRDSLGNVTLTLVSQDGGVKTTTALGDPVQVSDCSDTTFNTTAAALGPPALAGTDPDGLTIVYQSGTASAGSTTGCIYNNMQGYVNHLTYSHNTHVDDQGMEPNLSTSCGSNPWMQARNVTFKDSMILNSAGASSCWGEGTRSQRSVTDPTTLVYNHLFQGGRGSITCPGGLTGAACYTEYSDSHVATTPPTTVYLTPGSPCAGNDPQTGNCAGVLGAMTTGTFPIALPDWHQYRLCHVGDAACNGKASLYSGGQANGATDGTDLGADFSKIDAAQTSTRYCNPNCGIGSFADLP